MEVAESVAATVQASDDEAVVFSWITHDSKAERDRIDEKVMADPRIKDSMDDAPFDGKRMIYGGFETLLEM